MAFSNDLLLVFVLVVAGFTLLIAVIYYLTKTYFFKAVTAEQVQVLEWGAFRISVIHALLMTIGFSVVREDYDDLRSVVNEQAIEVEQLYKGLESIGSDETDDLRKTVERLADLLAREEWVLLGDGRLSPAASVLIAAIDARLITLASDPQFGSRLDRSLDSLASIQRTRTKLQLSVVAGPTRLFWSIALLGFLFTTICFLGQPGGRFSMLVICMFGALNGAVLFGIVLMSNPFAGIVEVKPVALEAAIARSMKAGSDGGNGELQVEG